MKFILKRYSWNDILDKYLVAEELSSDEYESLDKFQKSVIQELKKSFKRITKKTNV